uniref:hypothetical protein n=1 Tax=Komagataeibacter kakiaceti TaxID=943261 RepID=UPI001F5A77CD
MLDDFSIATLPPADIALNLARLDHPGHADLTLRLDQKNVFAALRAHEGADGFVAVLSGLDALAPLDLSLDLNGARDDTRLALA